MARLSDAPDPLGKRSLFWAPGPGGEEEDDARPGKEPLNTGKHALFSAPGGAAEARPRGDRAGGSPGILPPVSLQCSSCGTSTEVDVTRFLGLHVPFFLWRPGRGFTRFMTCPSCRRRTWLSASWTPWSAH